MAKKSAPTKKSPQSGEAINQHKKLAMGMDVNTGGKAGMKGPKTPC